MHVGSITWGMKTQKLFIAFPLPDIVRSAAEQTQLRLRAALAEPIRWTNPEDFHITMVFLGHVTEAQRDKVIFLLEKYSKEMRAVSMRLDRVDVFSHPSSPSVLMIRVAVDDDSIRDHIARLKELLSFSSIAVDPRPWQPHITLGRTKRQRPLDMIDQISVPVCSWRATSMTLMRSNVKHAGPTYTTLSTYQFV